MKPINTIPVESFLEKVRIASKSNQKSVSLELREAVSLADTISIMMARLIYKVSSESIISQPTSTKIDADGGGFN